MIPLGGIPDFLHCVVLRMGHPLPFQAIRYAVEEDTQLELRRSPFIWEVAGLAGFATGVKTGLSNFDDEMSLGYSEFIALNTHMIQKILRRVEMLEDIIQSIYEIMRRTSHV